MGQVLCKKCLSSDDELPEQVTEVLTLNDDQVSTSRLIYLPAEMIDMILKFLDKENKKKLRLVSERYITLYL